MRPHQQKPVHREKRKYFCSGKTILKIMSPNIVEIMPNGNTREHHKNKSRAHEYGKFFKIILKLVEVNVKRSVKTKCDDDLYQHRKHKVNRQGSVYLR